MRVLYALFFFAKDSCAELAATNDERYIEVYRD